MWTPETVSKLFEVGPTAYTPGTKMPEQTIGSAEDRAALVRVSGEGDEVATAIERQLSPFAVLACAPRARADNPRWCAACGRGGAP